MIPHTYIQPPPDGVYDFSFVAAHLSELTAQVISPIRVRQTLIGAAINGICVHALNNANEVRLAPQVE